MWVFFPIYSIINIINIIPWEILYIEKKMTSLSKTNVQRLHVIPEYIYKKLVERAKRRRNDSLIALSYSTWLAARYSIVLKSILLQR